jgi:DNA-binding NtrC family response regulator
MKQHILAVDDEPHMLKLLERIFTEKTSYGIRTTSNALEAPELLEAHPIDLIISDLKMPGLDGLDLLRLVKERGGGQEVIIITAFGSLDSALECMEHGVFDYITKPFKKEQIICAVDRAMRQQAAREDAKRLAAILEAEPFDEARRLMLREYVVRLAERHGRDIGAMADRSGLSAEVVEAELRRARDGEPSVQE